MRKKMSLPACSSSANSALLSLVRRARLASDATDREKR
jgi:hypothetical protein